MIHRVATSELYRSNPTVVRCHMAFRDFVEAHVMLDYADDERKAAEARAKEGGHGR